MDDEIGKIYGNRLRVRICGLCWDDDRLLLANHSSVAGKNVWLPPGGGLEYGETLDKALKREFWEETGLEIRQLDFAFGCEFVREPLHALELFFNVVKNGGTLKTGYDPELQIIQDVRFFSENEINGLSQDELHGIFRIARNPNELRKLTGFYSI
ncbi:MAG TPA: NUDIX hydrolase [Chryseolinea sp.]|nr:NUDIX hydrolase [Chryseolinea sp.]